MIHFLINVNYSLLSLNSDKNFAKKNIFLMTEKVKRVFTFSFCTDKASLLLDPNMLMSDVHVEIEKEIPKFKGFSFKYVSNAQIVDANKTKVSEVSEKVLTVVSIPVKIIFENQEKLIEMKPWDTSNDIQFVIKPKEEIDQFDVFISSIEGKKIEKIPAPELFGKTVEVRKDHAQLMETRKAGFADDISLKALEIVKWIPENAIFLLKNNMLEDEELTRETFNMYPSFALTIDALDKMKASNYVEAMKLHKKANEETAKTRAEKEFLQFEHEYAKNHEFSISFPTAEAKEKASQKGYKTIAQMYTQWKECVISHPDLAYNVAIAAMIFTNSHQMVSNTKYFVDKLGLDASVDYSFIQQKAMSEDLLTETIKIDDKVSPESIQCLTDMGIDFEVAVRALFVTDGNIEHAANIYFAGDLESIENNRGIDPNACISKSFSLRNNYRSGEVCDLLVKSIDDANEFYNFMKASGLKDASHYINCIIFAKNIGYLNELDECSIITKAFNDKLVSVKDIIDSHKTFGKKMSDLPEEVRTKLTTDFPGIDQDMLALLYTISNQNIESLSLMLSK